MVIAAVAVLSLAASTSWADPLAQQQAKSSKPASPPMSDLDRLLAPVALYPDSLLAQMLLCAGDPAQVVKLHTWLGTQTVKGTELQDAATIEGFEPSFVALTLFPQVVKYMADQRDWTTRLGKAFASDKQGVFASIQRLRKQAQSSGALKDTPQQDVQTNTTSKGEQVIVIEPANPQIIYVPQYDPQVVYVPQPTTTVVVKDDDDDADAAVAGLIGFTAGIALGAAIDNDYYYGPYGWHGGGYMYNDAWDDYYDAREDAREDWTDHREDLVEERGERARDSQEQRTDRTETRQEGRTERQQNRPETQATRSDVQAAAQQRSTTSSGASSREARGHSTTGTTQATRSSTSGSGAFSGYSSGGSTRAASSRGQASRGASRGGGGRRR